MSGPRRRHRGKVAALIAAALCLVVSLLSSAPTAAGDSPLPSDRGSGVPGVPLTLTAGGIGLSTGLVDADLPNGANGPVTLSINLCIPQLKITCVGVLSQFSLMGNFKDAAGKPLYSGSAPAVVSWTCNDRVCPPTSDFIPGTSTVTQLQIAEFREHTMYVALRNPNGTFQSFAPAPACNGVEGAPLPTGTINEQATGGRQFCVDVGAISRTDAQCETACSSWSGPLRLPVLFAEDPRFMGT
jgi:hypothetical protein